MQQGPHEIYKTKDKASTRHRLKSVRDSTGAHAMFLNTDQKNVELVLLAREIIRNNFCYHFFLIMVLKGV